MALAPGRPPPPRRPRRDTDDKLRNQQSTREQLEPQASRGARRGRQERRRAAGSVYHVGTQEPRRPTVERQRPETNPNWTVGLTFPPRYGGAAERARGRTLDGTRETGLRRARYDPATHSAGHETRERPVDRPTTHARPDTGRHGGDETPPWGGTLRHPRRTAPDTRVRRQTTPGRGRTLDANGGDDYPVGQRCYVRDVQCRTPTRRRTDGPRLPRAMLPWPRGPELQRVTTHVREGSERLYLSGRRLRGACDAPMRSRPRAEATERAHQGNRRLQTGDQPWRVHLQGVRRLKTGDRTKGRATVTATQRRLPPIVSKATLRQA